MPQAARSVPRGPQRAQAAEGDGEVLGAVVRLVPDARKHRRDDADVAQQAGPEAHERRDEQPPFQAPSPDSHFHLEIGIRRCDLIDIGNLRCRFMAAGVENRSVAFVAES